MLSLLGLGCLADPGTANPGADADPSAPDAAPPGAPDAAPGGGMPDANTAMLNGTPPASPKAAPDFTVTNRDGTSRTKADLLGHPTVIWFYPAAFTGG